MQLCPEGEAWHHGGGEGGGRGRPAAAGERTTNEVFFRRRRDDRHAAAHQTASRSGQRSTQKPAMLIWATVFLDQGARSVCRVHI